MTSAQLQAVLKLQRKDVIAVERSLARSTGEAALRTRRQVLALLNQLDGPVTSSTRVSAMQSVRRIIKAGGDGELRRLSESVPEMVRKGAMRAADITELAMLSRKTPKAVVQTFSTFQRAMREEKMFPIAGDKLEAWAERFGTEWDAGFTQALRGIQDTFTKASMSGLDWRAVSKQITSDAGELMTRGEVTGTVDRFADVFSRTMSTEIDNMASRSLGEALGLDLYINCGVLDDGQTEECYAACNAGAMTLEDWASGYGDPPRRFGCRCVLGPVPFDPGITVENPALDEKAASAATTANGREE